MSRIVAPHPHIVHQARPVSWIRHRAGERRLDDESARLLARQVFFKYDTNRSGFMNSQEAAHMVSDLYLSINEHQPTSQQDGLDFMVANDINNDHNMSLADFEDIFVRHLSTHDQTGYSLTSPHVTAFAEEIHPRKSGPSLSCSGSPSTCSGFETCCSTASKTGSATRLSSTTKRVSTTTTSKTGSTTTRRLSATTETCSTKWTSTSATRTVCSE